MKKLILLLMASLLVASSAFAVIDEDSNMMGIYFDLGANTACLTGVAPYSTVPAYVMVTNPSFEALYGYEFGYAVQGTGMMMTVVLNGIGPINVGVGNNYVVGLGSPTNTSEATLLATLNFFYMDTTGGPVSFDLLPSNPSSNDLGLPTLLLANDQLLPVGFSTIDGHHCAIINGACEEVVATDNVTFDSVKSLYR